MAWIADARETGMKRLIADRFSTYCEMRALCRNISSDEVPP